MPKKHILNGLTLSLMLSIVPMPAHAGMFSWINNFFNKPTKNALMATTAVAGVSMFAALACIWSWWKTSDRTKEKVIGIVRFAEDKAPKSVSARAASLERVINPAHTTEIAKLSDRNAKLKKANEGLVYRILRLQGIRAKERVEQRNLFLRDLELRDVAEKQRLEQMNSTIAALEKECSKVE